MCVSVSKGANRPDDDLGSRLRMRWGTHLSFSLLLSLSLSLFLCVSVNLFRLFSLLHTNANEMKWEIAKTDRDKHSLSLSLSFSLPISSISHTHTHTLSRPLRNTQVFACSLAHIQGKKHTITLMLFPFGYCMTHKTRIFPEKLPSQLAIV